jgi:hypothetical protein
MLFVPLLEISRLARKCPSRIHLMPINLTLEITFVGFPLSGSVEIQESTQKDHSICISQRFSSNAL